MDVRLYSCNIRIVKSPQLFFRILCIHTSFRYKITPGFLPGSEIFSFFGHVIRSSKAACSSSLRFSSHCQVSEHQVSAASMLLRFGPGSSPCRLALVNSGDKRELLRIFCHGPFPTSLLQNFHPLNDFLAAQFNKSMHSMLALFLVHKAHAHCFQDF